MICWNDETIGLIGHESRTLVKLVAVEITALDVNDFILDSKQTSII